MIVIVLMLASVLSMGSLGDTILSFAFMSMGLRGAAIFVPLCGALWCRGCILKTSVSLAIVAGPVTVLLFNLVQVLPFDPIFAGVLVSFIIMLVGYIVNLKRESK